MDNKKKYGQYFTTNYNYILQNFIIPEHIKIIIEPFTGNGDLLNFIENKDKYVINCYDIEPKKEFIIKQDTILEPPINLDKSFILTNPPYLARNKSNDKYLYDKYKTNDLYKCFIQILINNSCLGGILIVPLNFICSIRKNDIELRKSFLEKFEIISINIFEEQVFKDTSYTICSFQFKLKNKENTDNNNIIICNIYPSNSNLEIKLNKENNYTIGGEIYNLKQDNNYKIERATRLTINKEFITNILVKCIDDNNPIGLSFTDNIDKYIDNTTNLSGRSYAILVIEPILEIEKQKKLIEKFNIYIKEKRDLYNSLFLTNYRESKNNNARKRISFNLIYEICNYLLQSE
jgi:hypothetical protein